MIMQCRCCAPASWLIAILIMIAGSLSPSVASAQGNVARYVYDDNGRLKVVISPSGEAVTYDYDPAGNPTGVHRYNAADFAILDFTPKAGAAGDQVQLFGVGFGVTANAVSFNGTPATVVSWSATQITVTVPSSATTGLIQVTKSGGASVQSLTPFSILPRLSVMPNAVTMLPDSTTQFTATLLSVPGGSTVIWSVNGIIGGNTDVGAISSNGFYHAPANTISPITVRASISGQDQWFGEAQVTVTENMTYVAAPQLTVQFGVPARSINTLVSVVKGVYVTSTSPSSVQRGAGFTLTLNGKDFTGASLVEFLLPSGPNNYGQNDAAITVNNIQVNANGTQLTAFVTVSATAVPGRRVVVVTTPAGGASTVDMGINTIQITQ